MALLDDKGLGYFVGKLKDMFAPKSHTHTKSQITDFPKSMPASDVSAWAKAASKPSYTKAEVGLGNVTKMRLKTCVCNFLDSHRYTPWLSCPISR